MRITIVLVALSLFFFVPFAVATDGSVHAQKASIAENHHPKAGYWEGNSGVSLIVTADGHISLFVIRTGWCTIKAENIPVGKEGGFAYKEYLPKQDYEVPADTPEEKFYRPEIVTLDKREMVEVLGFSGVFDSPITGGGFYRYLVCGKRHLYLFEDPRREWNVKWVRPLDE